MAKIITIDERALNDQWNNNYVEVFMHYDTSTNTWVWRVCIYFSWINISLYGINDIGFEILPYWVIYWVTSALDPSIPEHYTRDHWFSSPVSSLPFWVLFAMPLFSRQIGYSWSIWRQRNAICNIRQSYNLITSCWVCHTYILYH